MVGELTPRLPRRARAWRPGGLLASLPPSLLQIALQRAELQLLREELQRQKELREQEDPEEALSGALSDRETAVNK